MLYSLYYALLALKTLIFQPRPGIAHVHTITLPVFLSVCTLRFKLLTVCFLITGVCDDQEKKDYCQINIKKIRIQSSLCKLNKDETLLKLQKLFSIQFLF